VGIEGLEWYDLFLFGSGNGYAQGGGNDGESDWGFFATKSPAKLRRTEIWCLIVRQILIDFLSLTFAAVNNRISEFGKFLIQESRPLEPMFCDVVMSPSSSGVTFPIEL